MFLLRIKVELSTTVERKLDKLLVFNSCVVGRQSADRPDGSRSALIISLQASAIYSSLVLSSVKQTIKNAASLSARRLALFFDNLVGRYNPSIFT